MPDSGDIYNRLAMLGFGPDTVANMTPQQQLMYFHSKEADGGISVCSTMAEARALVASLHGGK